ncbi:glycosyltransferase family 4 protein [Haloferula sp. A504]|uniref:glycosyltransferase family 4 protein n=1 Tax=Haloferula sp. A504 TaxID=3373601 RepID=UPI0037BF2181
MLTDIHNEEGWERATQEGLVPKNVRVRFLRKHRRCSENRFVAHLQSWLSFRRFNSMVLKAALEWHSEEAFDLCHHVTVAAWRLPSPLWKMPIPFIWGPIGGAGVVGRPFRRMLSPSARIFEAARDISTWRTLSSKAFRDCMAKSAVVFPANEETLQLLEPYRPGKDLRKLPIASLPEAKVTRFACKKVLGPKEGELKLFAGGNMIGSKGLSMALKALAIVRDRGVPFHYTIAGGGPEIPKVRKLIEVLDLESEVTLHRGFRGEEYVTALHSHDIYFLPSLREGTPVTMLEALLAGCFPVVAKASTQGEIAAMVNGIAAEGSTPEEMEHALAMGLLWCDSNREEMAGIAAAAPATIAAAFSLKHYIAEILESYRVSVAATPVYTPPRDS